MARRSDHTREELTKLILSATRDSIREEGATAISSRKIAKRVGYTVGTIFQVFGSMDRLILAVNTDTLSDLQDACAAVPTDIDMESRLRGLAAAFLNFAKDRRNEWDAIITYQYAEDHWADPDYAQRIAGLLDIIADTVSDNYTAQDAELHDADVRLLWTALYGIFALGSANRLTQGYEAEKLLEALIDLYLTARRA